MSNKPSITICIAIVICFANCNPSEKKVISNKETIQSEIEKILKIQEDAYDQNNEAGRKLLASTCDDSLLFIGGDNGGLATTADFYVHDLADGYSKRPANRTYRIYDHTVIVTSVYQSFKLFNRDTIFFNARSTKVFVKNQKDWKMAYTTYAPLPIIYTKPQYTDPRRFQDYAGLYRESPTITDTVSIVEGKIFLATTGSEKSELLPLNDSTFISKGYFGKTVFARDHTNKVTHNYYEFPDGQRLIFPKIK